MPSLPRLNERSLNLLLSYSFDSDEDVAEGLINAFLAANIDVFDKPTLLADWVDPDILESIQRSPDRPIYFGTEIWDHQVVITSEEVRVYSSSGTHNFS